jgi:trehalose/maltose transport system substrate-binding protein
MQRLGNASRSRRRRAAVVSALLATSTLVACSSDSGPPTLAWYINPDNGGQKEIAARCTEAAGGKYKLETSLLPNDASAQREQLLRRLAAKDSSIALMSLDPVFVAEFSQAGFLAPIPAADAKAFTDGVVKGAVAGGMWNGKLVAIPFWANTQLLWYRKSVAAKAGLDPATTPVTWDQLVKAAKDTKTTIAVQGKRYEGYVVWINALIESAGGHVIESSGKTGADIKLGLETPQGELAAKVIAEVANSGAVGPSLSTADEEAARALFQGSTGGFMVNWPYVWAAGASAVKDGSLQQSVVDDYGWAQYPESVQGTVSKPPLGGIELGIGAYTAHPDLALDAAKCITTVENMTYYMVTNGNPAAKSAVFDDPAVKQAFPMAAVIRASLDSAGPRPQTQFYGDVSSALQRTFHPPASVNQKTPQKATDLITGVLKGDQLL